MKARAGRIRAPQYRALPRFPRMSLGRLEDHHSEVCSDANFDHVQRANLITANAVCIGKGDPVLSIHAGEEIINEIERESNACKLKELAKKLNDAMLAQEREKVTQRILFAKTERTLVKVAVPGTGSEPPGRSDSSLRMRFYNQLFLCSMKCRMD